jgi:hypothetical protein
MGTVVIATEHHGERRSAGWCLWGGLACPHCGKPINVPALMRAAGGKAGRGKAKARSSEQARAAVMARWNKVKKKRLAAR